MESLKDGCLKTYPLAKQYTPIHKYKTGQLYPIEKPLY